MQNDTVLIQRWRDFWKRIGATGAPEESFAQLESTYASPPRAYHNLAHIADCLARLDEVRENVPSVDALDAAIWFHDVIYDPTQALNEERSAAWAAELLRAGSVDQTLTEHVTRLILATRHTDAPTTSDEKWMVDIDLSILGAQREKFDQYDWQIRMEYEFVPPDAYRKGRRKVLQSFLDRQFIYHTDFFRERFETAARENLVTAMDRLDS